MTGTRKTRAIAGLALAVIFVTVTLSACNDSDHGSDNAAVDSSGPGADRTAVIETTPGPVQGRVQDDVDEFAGIPYARPPLAELRWRPPQPPEPWTNRLDAVAFGNTWAQPLTPGVFAARSDHEDCLFLTIFAPAKRAPEGGLPV